MGGQLNLKKFEEAIQAVANPLPGSVPLEVKYKLPVKQIYDGDDIMSFLSKALMRVPKEVWVEKIGNKKLILEGAPATIYSIVRGGNVIEHKSEPQIEPQVSIDIKFIYEDDDILVISKPAPLPMHPCGRFNKNSLIEIMKLAFPKEEYKLAHRLDANTTGLVVLAKNKVTASRIAKQFELNLVSKEYLALVEGLPNVNSFNSNESISLLKTASGGREIVNDGVEAYTEFEVLERRKESNTTLLSVKPFSGRTNQIRIHLASLGYPIVGDTGYKDSEFFRNNPLTYSEDSLFLHAWKLTLNLEGHNISLNAPIPRKFNFVEK